MVKPRDNNHDSIASPAAFIRCSLSACLALWLCQCTTTTSGPAQAANVVVSVKEQKLAVYAGDGHKAKVYPISTSKFGLSDKPGTYGTPLGLHEVVAKIGHGAPPGAVFKSRQMTGEVIKPNAPGRDPIVTRIMWLRGMEKQNQNAYSRCIYIHGTAEERTIGKPTSYGCIRMKSRDVMDLFNNLGIGARVLIVQSALPGTVIPTRAAPPTPTPSDAPPIFLNPAQQPPQPVVASTTTTEAAPHKAAPMSSYQTRHLENGAVIYSSGSSSSPVVLKSRRSASAGL